MSNTSNSTFIITHLLEKTAKMFSDLSQLVNEMAANDPPEPPRLGSAPPALVFSRLMTELAGPEGAVQIMRGWASGLETMGREQHGAAVDYQNTEVHNENILSMARGQLEDIFNYFDEMVSGYRTKYGQ